jgi:hypothetical protein
MKKSKFTVKRFADQITSAIFAFVFFNTWVAFIIWFGIYMSPVPEPFRYSYVECLGIVTIIRGIVWSLIINIYHAAKENHEYDISKSETNEDGK